MSMLLHLVCIGSTQRVSVFLPDRQTDKNVVVERREKRMTDTFPATALLTVVTYSPRVESEPSIGARTNASQRQGLSRR